MREEQTEPRRQGVKQEASRRATDGLQPDGSDAEEFQAESRQGGKVPGGRSGRRGKRVETACCQMKSKRLKWFVIGSYYI